MKNEKNPKLKSDIAQFEKSVSDVAEKKPLTGSYSVGVNEISNPSPIRLTVQHEFRLQSKHMEKPTGVSMTVPGEAMTIQEILDRFTKGLSPHVLMNAVDYEAEDFDAIDMEKARHMDPTDLQFLADNLKAINEKKRELLKTELEENARRQAAREEREKQISDILDERLKEKTLAGKTSSKQDEAKGA